MQREHLATLAGEHAADLVVATLGQHKLGCSGIEDTQFGGETGRFFSRKHQRAAGKQFGEAGRKRAVHGGSITFGHFVLRRCETVNECGLIGEEQESGRVFIEATDARDLRIARAPARRKEAVNIGTFAFVVRADESGWFMQEKQQSLGMIERLTVNEDIAWVGFGCGVIGDFPAGGNAGGIDPIARLAA